MTEEMMKEILDDWNSWKYDIMDMNKSEWNQRDQSKLDTITTILENELKNTKSTKQKIMKGDTMEKQILKKMLNKSFL